MARPERSKEQFEVTYTIPSAGAEALATGTADIGISPSPLRTDPRPLSFSPRGDCLAKCRAVDSVGEPKAVGQDQDGRAR